MDFEGVGVFAEAADFDRATDGLATDGFGSTEGFGVTADFGATTGFRATVGFGSTSSGGD